MDFFKKVSTALDIANSARNLASTLWKLKDAAASMDRELAESLTVEIDGYREQLKTLVAAL